jgi:succinyl-CoA synthetase beta subunit
MHSALHINPFISSGKQLLRKFGINTQRGDAASTSAEATSIALSIKDAKEYVIKAQVHAGGRGKGHFTNGFKGGVKFTSNPEQAGDLAASMIGSNLVTKQTTAAGQPCHKVFVGESVDLASEKYFAILMDRSHNGPVMVGSAQGGMDIEAVAEATPEAIFTLPIDITNGLTPQPPVPQLAKICTLICIIMAFRLMCDTFVCFRPKSP